MSVLIGSLKKASQIEIDLLEYLCSQRGLKEENKFPIAFSEAGKEQRGNFVLWKFDSNVRMGDLKWEGSNLTF